MNWKAYQQWLYQRRLKKQMKEDYNHAYILMKDDHNAELFDLQCRHCEEKRELAKKQGDEVMTLRVEHDNDHDNLRKKHGL